MLNFENYGLEAIHRSKNKYVDALATLVLKIGQIEEDVIQIPLEVKQEPIVVSKVEEANWIQEIKGKLEDPKTKDLKEIQTFMLLYGQLYKKLRDRVLAKCISEDIGIEILFKVHSKVCGLEEPTLARRVQRMGYFWPV